VIAFDAGDFKDDVIAIARQAHAYIYVDRLDGADNPEHWQDAINRGATGIQTNKPGELVNYLRPTAYTSRSTARSAGLRIIHTAQPGGPRRRFSDSYAPRFAPTESQPTFR
jgi:hypothetical protein